MGFIRAALARIAGVFTRNDSTDADMREEMEAHLAMETAENIRRGMRPDTARREAMIAAGGLTQAAEAVHDRRGLPWLEGVAADFRYALRALRRSRGFAIVVVITLALGIGANTAMFTLLRGTLLRPLPNRNGAQLVYLRQSAPAAKFHNVLFSVPEITDYRGASKTLGEIADYSSVMPTTLTGDDDTPVRVKTAVISGNYFDVVGLGPVIGRVMSKGDDGAAATSVTVLSWEFWMDHFGGDPHIVGKPIRVNERVTTVIGVLQPAPKYPEATDIYVNTVTSPHHLSATMVTERTHRMSEVFARLAPNATVEDARREINRIATTVFADHPESYEKAAHYEISVVPLRDAVNERSSLMFSLLMGAAAFVLLIACANVANLTLMRGVGREREMQVRAALGAARGRLRRLIVLENLTLALVGGAIGLLVAFAGLKLLVAFAAQFSPRAAEIRIDGVVLAVGLATSVAAAIALAYLQRINGADTESLAPSGGGRRMTLGRARQRLQRSLVVTQVALCMVLLTGAGLLTRTLTKLDAVDVGVRTEHVLTMDLPIGGDLMREIRRQPEHLAEYNRMRDRVAALPGVQLAAIGMSSPLRSAFLDLDMKPEGRALPPDRPTPHAGLKTVDPNYFTAAGIPLLSGRGISSTDVRGSAAVVVLSRSFATLLFGDENPIGRRVAWTGEILKFSPVSGDWRTVVGVVGDTRDGGIDAEPSLTVYQPFAQEIIPTASLVIRTTADPDQLRATVMRAIHVENPRQLIERVATLEQVRDERVAPRRLNALFIAAFGALAFVIAMVGIAGVLAFSVSSRTSEIGIRMSLGADAGRVRRMILGEGGALLAVGIAVGAAGALVGSRLLRTMLFGVSPHDPLTLGLVALVLVAVGVAACWLPAARAARVDPAVALRAD